MAINPMGLFEVRHYREYLRNRLPTQGQERGIRSRLAQHLRCQTAFVSQVLGGKNHFSLEHAEAINQFLDHSDDEAEYFLLLVQLGRAGSVELESRLKKQLSQIRVRRQKISTRLKVEQKLDEQAQWIYYSQWIYSAVHILSSIPNATQTPSQIAKKLSVSTEQIQRVLDFLLQVGLLQRDKTGYSIGKTHIHIGSQSPVITRHHSNWRQRVMRRLEQPRVDDLHFTGVYSLSQEDYQFIRELLLQTIEKANQVISKSSEEILINLNADLYAL